MVDGVGTGGGFVYGVTQRPVSTPATQPQPSHLSQITQSATLPPLAKNNSQAPAAMDAGTASLGGAFLADGVKPMLEANQPLPAGAFGSDLRNSGSESANPSKSKFPIPINTKSGQTLSQYVSENLGDLRSLSLDAQSNLVLKAVDLATNTALSAREALYLFKQEIPNQLGSASAKAAENYQALSEPSGSGFGSLGRLGQAVSGIQPRVGGEQQQSSLRPANNNANSTSRTTSTGFGISKNLSGLPKIK